MKRVYFFNSNSYYNRVLKSYYESIGVQVLPFGAYEDGVGEFILVFWENDDFPRKNMKTILFDAYNKMTLNDVEKYEDEGFDILSTNVELNTNWISPPYALSHPFLETIERGDKVYRDNRLFVWTRHKIYTPYKANLFYGPAEYDSAVHVFTHTKIVLLDRDEPWLIPLAIECGACAGITYNMAYKFGIRNYPLVVSDIGDMFSKINVNDLTDVKRNIHRFLVRNFSAQKWRNLL